ncbi:MAG: hypothetical protein K2Z81_25190 [Cyanobacteria bacterium]|nr:hypothetical protein [Cyanobacteriota bacterium]
MDKNESPKKQRELDDEQNQSDRLAMEAVEGLCQFGRSEFKKLDSDRNGRLTESELDNAIASGQYKDDKLSYLKCMRKHISEIQAVNYDGRLRTRWEARQDDKDGISGADLTVLEKWASEYTDKIEEARAMREVLKRNFATIDTDKSGGLTIVELISASENRKLSLYDRWAIQLARSFVAGDTWTNRITTYNGAWNHPTVAPANLDRYVESLERTKGSRKEQLKWDVAKELGR